MSKESFLLKVIWHSFLMIFFICWLIKWKYFYFNKIPLTEQSRILDLLSFISITIWLLLLLIFIFL